LFNSVVIANPILAGPINVAVSDDDNDVMLSCWDDERAVEFAASLKRNKKKGWRNGKEQ
jgi:hypothetical protein